MIGMSRINRVIVLIAVIIIVLFVLKLIYDYRKKKEEDEKKGSNVLNLFGQEKEKKVHRNCTTGNNCKD